MEHSTLPDLELLGYFARIQRETVNTLRSTLAPSSGMVGTCGIGEACDDEKAMTT